MAKYKGPHFILEFKLYTQKFHNDLLNKYFYCAEKMYNKTLFYAKNQYFSMLKDNEYIDTLNNYINSKKELERLEQILSSLDSKDKNNKKIIKELKSNIKDLNKLIQEHFNKLKFIREEKYNLSEYALQKYINVQRKNSYYGVLDSTSVQKIASIVWKAVESVIFGDGKKFHFKYNDLTSIEGKSNKSGIRFNKKDLCLNFNNMIIPIKVRKNDYYAKEALENEIAYCRIIRKPFKNVYKYFLQIVFKGVPPIKHNLGKGNVGIDQGTSTIAAIGDKEGLFEPLAPNINDYNKKIIAIQRKIDRSLKVNNPNCYNKNGTIKKDTKLYKSNHCKKLIQNLKNEYRLKTLYIKMSHNKLANKILSLGDEFSTEDMNFKALQKRAKKDSPPEKQEKESTIKLKDGSTKKIHKNKKKKRYGKSLNNHAPSSLMKTMETKLSYFGKELIKVNTKKYKASQYHHDSDTYIKSSLKERFKIIEGKKVQRDLYSAYLIKNKLDNETIDRDKCIKDFKKFVKINNKVMKELSLRSNLPKCMGI